MVRHEISVITTIAMLLCGAADITAQEPSAADLAKQLSNPVASLVSIPLQYNWDQGVGIDDDTRTTMNFQPVIPLGISDDWNLIIRWIMPYVSQPRLADGVGPTSGFSDIVASTFFSPAEPGAFIWGVGPVFLLPMSNDPLLGTGKWAAGPTFVILKQLGSTTLGALANHLWSFAGDDFTGGAPRGDVNGTFIQPFVSYTTASAVTYSLNVEAAANWEADEEWTVPLHLAVTKLTRFGPFPFSIGGGVGYFLTAPNDQPDWRFRLIGTVLLPRT
jgi:hypothetical protein